MNANDNMRSWFNDDELYNKYLNFPDKVPFNIVKFIEQNIPSIKLIESNIAKKGISGFIKQEDNGDIFICVHQFDHPNRKRFTIAHELGHYFRHRSQIKEGFVDGIGSGVMPRGSSENNISTAEMEANQFAAEVLMPENAFKNIHTKKNGNITEIAEYFIVSEAATYTRAKMLGLLYSDNITYFM